MEYACPACISSILKSKEMLVPLRSTPSILVAGSEGVKLVPLVKISNTSLLEGTYSPKAIPSQVVVWVGS